ncbi:MAG: geranylgeranylglyceryl/heptaprenylglyceryl phosphate synthase [Chitinispirillaceae bacterium]|jgi:phosphoglycerol geranylgeranyltransferase|nr:geranylgeranylglyceryl/heptaprenylglyceryl phosphate synthase [Chitinispirillaceae bacterium]
MKMPVYESIRKTVKSGKRQYWILLDPDDFSLDDAQRIAVEAEKKCGVDVILIGGSLLYTNKFDSFVAAVKKKTSIPVILFPGDATQLSAQADALLYLSLVSGRNPVNLIGEHVKAAPIIRTLGIEPIPTAYLLVESGAVSSVEFMSNTRPLPQAKPDIAAAHALAACYMGMKLVYLEAGSGALQPVPAAMIKKVKASVDIPVIVGGGIRTAKTAREILSAGADIIVTGNMLKEKTGLATMKAIAKTVKSF